MLFKGTHDDDDLNGTTGSDVFELGQGGEDTAFGDAGNDLFRMGAALDAGDRIDGGTGSDKVVLRGDYSAGLVLDGATLANIEILRFDPGFDYDLTLADGNIASGKTLTIDAWALEAAHGVTVDGSAETDGAFVFHDGAGDDDVTGGANRDVFHMTKGGHDTVDGGGGDDLIDMATTFGAGDQIDGGAGNDRLMLDPFSGTVDNIVHVEDVVLGGRSSYNIVWTADIGAGIVIDARGTHGVADLVFDGSAITTGGFEIYAHRERAVLKGGGGEDVFFVQNTTSLEVHGNGGDDRINVGHLRASDVIDGGGGHDVVTLHGGSGIVFTAATMTNVEMLLLFEGANYKLTANDATVAAHQRMTIDGSRLGAHTGSLDFDGSAETDGHFLIVGGGGNDVLIGSAQADRIQTGDGTDHVTGGGGGDNIVCGNGADTLIYLGASDSTGTAHDTVLAFDAATDKFDLSVAVAGFDGTIDHVLRAGHLDEDLHAATGGQAGHAWIVHGDAGNLAGHEFLVVDVNGNAVYDSGADYAIEITGYTGTVTAADFI